MRTIKFRAIDPKEIMDSVIFRGGSFMTKNGKSQVAWNTKSEVGYATQTHYQYEVIGNIYENPELLTK